MVVVTDACKSAPVRDLFPHTSTVTLYPPHIVTQCMDELLVQLQHVVRYSAARSYLTQYVVGMVLKSVDHYYTIVLGLQ